MVRQQWFELSEGMESQSRLHGPKEREQAKVEAGGMPHGSSFLSRHGLPS